MPTKISRFPKLKFAPLEEEGLNWGEPTERVTDELSAFMYQPPGEEKLISLQTIRSDKGKELLITSQYSSTTADTSDDIALWPKFFSLAQSMYGQGNEGNRFSQTWQTS